tara:strand:+ start:2088 stop:3110 length:1023 start_codon:yes stop_codon:yes gene_type:complete
MSIFTSNAAAVNQGQSIITCTDNSDFSGVPSGSVVIINNDHLAVVDSGTAASSNNSTLTLRSPWPSDLPDITAGKLFVLAGAPAIAEAVKSTLTVSQTLTTTKQALQAIIDAQGTAATADLTESSLDTTIGNVLKVGDFGIGLLGDSTSSETYLGPDETDKDSALTQGVYRLEDGKSGILEVFEKASDRHVQRYTESVGSMSYARTLTRFSLDGGATWSEWDLVATAANNSLIEHGTNANGSYTKFPDGTLICTHHQSGASGSVNVSGSVFRTSTQVWTYPINFINTPVVTRDLSGNLGFCWSGMGSIDNEISRASWVAFSGSSTPTVPTCGLTAIGRWK